MKHLYLKTILILGLSLVVNNFTYAQGLEKILQNGIISGNFQLDGMYYNQDSLIGAPDVPQRALMNSFANINYTNGGFSAGVRFENYLYAIQGMDQRYKGIGLPYRYASFEKDKFSVTIGNSYDQFGSGLIYRSWQDFTLGYDNSLDGINIKYKPWNGVTLKGIWGLQRFFFDHSKGIIRGFDGEIAINELCSKLADKNLKVTVGGSFVSKYESADDPVYKYPANVASYGGRANIAYKNFSIYGEHIHKINDPSAINNRIYKPGNATLMQMTYAKKGLGLYLAAIRTDNFSFKTEREAIGNDLNINYIPSLSKQTTYSLPALYPYATQANGEFGFQAQSIFTFKKKSKLGGKYGTSFSLTYCQYNAIGKDKLNDSTDIGTAGTLGYKAKFFDIGKEIYYQNFNIEFSKKISKTFKMVFDYFYVNYNAEVIEGHGTNVYAHVGVTDLTFAITEKHSIHTELQYMQTKQDDGSWGMILVEYAIAPKWFFSIADQHNFGNSVKEKRIHYYSIATAYSIGSTRIALNYGRQMEGIFCVGGVCRFVPASNGLTLTITSSF